MKIEGRFSRATVQGALRARRTASDAEFNRITGHYINEGTGWAQVDPKFWTPLARAECTQDRIIMAAVAYGDWRATTDLLEAIC